MRDDQFCSELERALDIAPAAGGTLARRQAWILATVQSLTAERGLTLATLCDMVLGENASDRSDVALIRAVRRLLDAAPPAVSNSQYPISNTQYPISNTQHPTPNTQLIPGQGHSEKMCLQLIRTLGGVVISIHGPRGGRKASIFFNLDDLLRGIYALQKPGDV